MNLLQQANILASRMAQLTVRGTLTKPGEPAAAAPPLSPTTRLVLLFAFGSFLSFAVTECVYAVLASSLAMLGDGASTVIDAATYLVNLYALAAAASPDAAARRRAGGRLVAPAISVVLTAITAWITAGAVSELLAPASRVDTRTMLLFGLANLAIDGANLAAFAAFPDAYRALLRVTMAAHEHDLRDYRGAHAAARGTLNMRSALTHVLADTFRSFAIIAAALTADYSAVSAPCRRRCAGGRARCRDGGAALQRWSSTRTRRGTDKEGDAAADDDAVSRDDPAAAASARSVSPKPSNIKISRSPGVGDGSLITRPSPRVLVTSKRGAGTPRTRPRRVEARRLRDGGAAAARGGARRRPRRAAARRAAERRRDGGPRRAHAQPREPRARARARGADAARCRGAGARAPRRRRRRRASRRARRHAADDESSSSSSSASAPPSAGRSAPAGRLAAYRDVESHVSARARGRRRAAAAACAGVAAPGRRTAPSPLRTMRARSTPVATGTAADALAPAHVCTARRAARDARGGGRHAAVAPRRKPRVRIATGSRGRRPTRRVAASRVHLDLVALRRRAVGQRPAAAPAPPRRRRRSPAPARGSAAASCRRRRRRRDVDARARTARPTRAAPRRAVGAGAGGGTGRRQ